MTGWSGTAGCDRESRSGRTVSTTVLNGTSWCCRAPSTVSWQRLTSSAKLGRQPRWSAARRCWRRNRPAAPVRTGPAGEHRADRQVVLAGLRGRAPRGTPRPAPAAAELPVRRRVDRPRPARRPVRTGQPAGAVEGAARSRSAGNSTSARPASRSRQYATPCRRPVWAYALRCHTAKSAGWTRVGGQRWAWMNRRNQQPSTAPPSSRTTMPTDQPSVIVVDIEHEYLVLVRAELADGASHSRPGRTAGRPGRPVFGPGIAAASVVAGTSTGQLSSSGAGSINWNGRPRRSLEPGTQALVPSSHEATPERAGPARRAAAAPPAGDRWWTSDQFMQEPQAFLLQDSGSRAPSALPTRSSRARSSRFWRDQLRPQGPPLVLQR